MPRRLLTDTTTRSTVHLFAALCAQEDYDTHCRACGLHPCVTCETLLGSALAMREKAFAVACSPLPTLGIARQS